MYRFIWLSCYLTLKFCGDLTCFFMLFFSFSHFFLSYFHRVFSFFFKQLGLNFSFKPYLGVMLFGILTRRLNAVTMKYWIEFLSATYEEADVVRVWEGFSKHSNSILCKVELVVTLVDFISNNRLFTFILYPMTCKYVDYCDGLVLIFY